MTRSLYISYNGITEPIVESQVIPYLRELSKKGIKFCLLTFEKKRLGRAEKNSIKKALNEKFPEGAPLEWHSLRYHKRPAVPAKAADIITGFIQSLYLIIKHRIDVVHARALQAALMGWPAAKLLSKKFIFDTRGIDSEEYVDAGAWRRGGFKHRAARLLEGFLIESSDHTVVLTQKFLEILKERHRNKKIEFSVIPCAVDTGRFRVAEGLRNMPDAIPGAGDKFEIIYIGSLGTWYMFDEMLDFFKAAYSLSGNARFLVLTQAGAEYVRDRIRQRNIDEDKVEIGWVRHEAVPGYLSRASAGIFFIRPVFSKLSSSPVKFGEYLASGLPVVINRGIGDTETIVKENRVGVVVEGFDPDSYKKAATEIKELLKDRLLSQRCRKAALTHLSLEKAVDSYLGIYGKLTHTER